MRLETCLLSVACILSTALAEMESNSENIAIKFSRSYSEGKKTEMGGGGEDNESHMSNNTFKWREKQLYNREKIQTIKPVPNIQVQYFLFFFLLEYLGTEKSN